MSIEEKADLELSVVIVILTRDRDILHACLTALRNQLSDLNAEIIVPCDVNSQHVLTPADEDPFVRFVSVEGNRTFAELRTIGVKQARGRIIALTEDHCTPAPEWATQILLAHKASCAAIGGAVEKKEPDSALNWAFYMADYLRYMTPIPEGPTNNLTDCNVSYKRAALEAVANVWAKEFHEPKVHAALQSMGEELWLCPNLKVYQKRPLNFRTAIQDRYAFGRLFSSTRAANFSGSRRLVFSLLSFLLPAVLVGRVAGHMFRKRRHTREFVRSLPHLVLISFVWSTGEFLGYVTRKAAATLTPSSTEAGISQRGQEAVI